MPKNVMKMLKPSPNRGKNAFDLSHRHVLGASFGELLPITTLETVPGDYFEFNCADLLRAMPMVTSPFMRAKQHIDFWFVPYTDLWHNFNQFITQKKEPMSSALNWADYVPHANLATIVEQITNPQLNFKDVVGQNYTKGASKLFDLLGYGRLFTDNSSHPDVNLWRIAAYNYIWYNEYRQQYYDDGTHGMNYFTNPSRLFSFDYMDCNTYTDAAMETYVNYKEQIQVMFQMRYRCWKKDLFTGMLPSTQFGAISAVDSELIGNNVYAMHSDGTPSGSISSLTGFKANSYSQFYGYDSATPIFFKVAASDTKNSYTHLDVLSLRQAQAVQIWRENALRAGNRVSDNMIAHYGESPSYQRDHRPTYIGSYDAPLNISDVNSTAQTGSGGNESLGDVAGKGLSSLDSKTLKFQSNDFGVIMGIFSLLPEAEYNSDGIDRMNQLLDRFDYFAPEMENVGLEAISSQNFYSLGTSVAFVPGYAPRYFGYKTKLDKCFGSFKTNGALQIWCSPKYDVTAMFDQSSPTFGTLPLQVLYVNPAIFDVNFVVDAETIGEQFLCDFFFDVKAVRPMTVLGLPTY